MNPETKCPLTDEQVAVLAAQERLAAAGAIEEKVYDYYQRQKAVADSRVVEAARALWLEAHQETDFCRTELCRLMGLEAPA